MNKKVNHIAYICDDKYVLPTIVSIQSLIDSLNKNDVKYIVHVCAVSLKQYNIDLLNSLDNDVVHVDVKIIDVRLYANKLNRINRKTHVSNSALIKFELANIFYELDSILYLDSDVIIKKDLDYIFNLSIDEYYLAAVKEYWKIYNNFYDGIDKENLYFNSGVMYLNLNKLRNDNISNKLWDAKLKCFNELDGKTVLMDQDAFNKVCNKKCYYLPIMYNCDPKLTLGWADWKLLNKEYGVDYKNGNDLFNDVVILHYLGKKDKPWKYKNCTRGDVWLKEYDKSIVNTVNLDFIDNKISAKDIISLFKITMNKRGLLGGIIYYCKTRYRKLRG